MEFNQSALKQLLDTDDETLKARVLLLAKELNIDKNMITPFFSDMKALRKMLMNLSQSDIDRAMRSLDKAKAEKIARDIKLGGQYGSK